jgi:hypothetical protein
MTLEDAATRSGAPSPAHSHMAEAAARSGDPATASTLQRYPLNSPTGRGQRLTVDVLVQAMRIPDRGPLERTR